MAAIKLIVGLGNPGKKYEVTRHNTGFWFVDLLARQYGGTLQQKDKFFGQCGQINVGGRAVHLLKPDTFMNLSGKSVQALASFYQISKENILVAHDELDISSGEVKLKLGGGHGGHNGLRDIIRCFGGNTFHRLRIGIGHPGHASQVTGYVLSAPTKQEASDIEFALDRAAAQIAVILEGDFEAAMQTLHSRSK